MKLHSHAFRLAWLWLLPVAAWADPDSKPERTFSRSFALAAQQDLHVDLRWGELEIQAVDGSDVEVTVTLGCDDDRARCRERLADVDVDARPRRGRLEVELTGLPTWDDRGADVRLVVGVPRQHRLTVDMGAGEISIEGLAADLDVDLGAGEIRVRMAEAAVRRVDLRAGVGETTLRHPGGDLEPEHRHLVGGSVRWADGQGGARVDCRVGAGEVDVSLD